MIAIPSGVRAWLATGHTDMRKGFEGLALLVHEKHEPRKPRAAGDEEVGFKVHATYPGCRTG